MVVTLSVVLTAPDDTIDAMAEMDAVEARDSMAGTLSTSDGIAVVLNDVAVAEMTATTDPFASVMTAVGDGAETVGRSVDAPGVAAGDSVVPLLR